MYGFVLLPSCSHLARQGGMHGHWEQEVDLLWQCGTLQNSAGWQINCLLEHLYPQVLVVINSHVAVCRKARRAFEGDGYSLGNIAEAY